MPDAPSLLARGGASRERHDPGAFLRGERKSSCQNSLPGPCRICRHAETFRQISEQRPIPPAFQRGTPARSGTIRVFPFKFQGCASEWRMGGNLSRGKTDGDASGRRESKRLRPQEDGGIRVSPGFPGFENDAYSRNYWQPINFSLTFN